MKLLTFHSEEREIPMKRILSLLLALALCLSLCPPGLNAQAASDGMSLVYAQGVDGSVRLSVTGVEPDRVIRGVQLELTLDGASYDPADIRIEPADSDAFSPSFGAITGPGGDVTTVTLYLVSPYALNTQETLPLGSLTYRGLGLAPIDARLGLIDSDQLTGGGQVELAALPLTPAADTENWGPSSKVKTTVSRGKGTVIAAPYGRENQTVAIKAEPAEGYQTESVQVNGQPAILQGEGVYTFPMPAGDAQVVVSFAQSSGEQGFTDVSPNSWYYSAVEFVSQRGIMTGVGPGRFDPTGATSRGMIATILYQLEGKPAVSGESVFTDVPDGKWYSNAIKWANQQGIVAGFDDRSYRPNKGITRQELALILYKYASYKGYDTTAEGNLDKFADSGNVSGFARKAMRWAVGSGLIGGNEKNQLNPKGGAQRAQAAVIFRAFLQDKLS